MPELNSMDLFGDNLPHSLEAEQSVLGAVLIRPDCLVDILEYLKPEYFYRPVHQELFGILVRMFAAAHSIDVITVLNAAVKEGVFATPDDAKVYLTQLAQVVPTTSNVESYARIVQEKYYLRSLVSVSQEIMNDAVEGHVDAKELLDAAEQRIFDIRQGKDATGLMRIDRVILDAYDKLQKLSGEDRDKYLGLPTGFSHLDYVLTGLNKSDLILIAARPGMGKTSFALNIASHVATHADKSVVIFSLEMSSEQLINRMLSSEASIPSQKLRTGELSKDDWIRLVQASQLLSDASVYVDDTPGINVAGMKAKLRRVKNLGLVVIDYLQLMSGSRRTDNRVQEVSEITRSLKHLAKEMDVPIVTLSQLSRGPESRSDHRPLLSDLRESGSIEQDADIVMFLYREAYYDRETEDHNAAECIVAKNRHGEARTVKLGWNGQYTRFSTLETYRNEE